MELKQHLIHRNYKKCEAKNQITIGDDYSVPDGKPDIASILQKRAEVHVEEVHTEKGKIKLRGSLKLWVLYLAERSMEVVSFLAMEFPFDEVLYMDGAVSGDNLKIDWSIENLQVNIVHPGKLSVRAVVTLYGEIMTKESHLITENLEEGENLHTKTSTFTLAEPVIDRKDSYRIRDEINLPVNKPNVQNILWKDLQIRGLDIRMQEGRLALKGEVLLFAVYQGEDEQTSVQWMEQVLPFHGTVDVAGLTPELFGLVETEISHRNIEIKPDYDGELRMFQVEMMLEIHMHLYEERSCHFLLDAYSTQEKLNLQSEEITYEKLRMCNQTKCRISGQEKIEEDLKILQIIGHQGDIQNKRCRMTESGILCEGTLEVQVLYVTASDRRPFGTAAVSVPFSQLIEIPEMKKEDCWKLQGKINQLFVTMAEGSQIEVRADLIFDVCVLQQCCLQNVTNISKEAYDQEAYKKRPGMCIHFVQPQETLWEIAKEHRTTVEEIKKCNELSLDEVTPGQKILLIKTMAEPVLHL